MRDLAQLPRPLVAVVDHIQHAIRFGAAGVDIRRYDFAVTHATQARFAGNLQSPSLRAFLGQQSWGGTKQLDCGVTTDITEIFRRANP